MRQRLNALLQQATQKNCVTVVAGTGYGKSMAVSSFLTPYIKETAWLYLTPLDNTDVRIWQSICTSFSKMLGKDLFQLQDCTFSGDSASFEKFMQFLYSALDRNKKYYFVLDDCHNVSNPTFFKLMQLLILERIPNMCVVIISREEIPFQTLRLIGRGLVAQITPEDLCLTKTEISDYMRFYSAITLSDKALEDFYRDTNGWFFVVHLAAITLKKGQYYNTNPLNTIENDVFQLLENATYATYSQPVKIHLLRFSLLERLPLELAVMLAGSDWPLIEKTIQKNTFIEQDPLNHIIRFHPLLLQFLRIKSSSLSEDEQTQVHLMSAEWFEKNGLKIDAIFHYEEIRLYDRILPILLTFNKAQPEKTMTFLQDVINRMPESMLQQNPILDFLHIKFMMNNFDMREVNRRLLSFCKQLEHTEDKTPEVREALGEVYLHMAFQHLITCGISRTYNFTYYFRHANLYLPHGSKLIHKPYISDGNYICNVSDPSEGEVERFISAIDDMMPFATAVLPNTYEGYADLARAEYAYFQKDIKKAEQYLQLSIKTSCAAQSTYVEINARYLEARVSVANGHFKKAAHAMDEQKKLVDMSNSTEGYALYDMTKSWFYCQLGYLDNVSSWIRDAEKSKEMLTPITFATDKLIRLQCLLQENQIYELLAILNTKETGFSFDNYLFGHIELTVLKAIAFYLIDEHHQAVLAFQQAYELAVPNKLILPFVEYGKYMRRLINAVGADTSIPTEWLHDIKTKAATYAKRIAAVKNEYNSHQMEQHKPELSRRELEVLTAIAQNLTREEIASVLNLSVNTVKSITLNIYNKLNVNSNIEAVYLATQLKLI